MGFSKYYEDNLEIFEERLRYSSWAQNCQLSHPKTVQETHNTIYGRNIVYLEIHKEAC